jgi:itaconate CoA-transferase
MKKAGPRPLDGITVVSLEHAIAAPFCTRQLADNGARVIKVERPGVGDFARKYDERTRGMASHFVWTNRSKESLTLDLKHEDAGPILNELLAETDVLVQNLAPGAAARMGLSFEALHKRFPKLIVCDISGYGEGGPYETKKAYDLLIQSESGFISVTGSPDAPAKAGCSIADIAAGSYAYSSILNALLLRHKTGLGSHLDVSMLESMVEWMSHHRGQVLRTPRFIPTVPFRSATVVTSCLVCKMSASGKSFLKRFSSNQSWRKTPVMTQHPNVSRIGMVCEG